MIEKLPRVIQQVHILFRDGTRLTFKHHPDYEDQPNFSNCVHIEGAFLCITDQTDTITLYPRDLIREVKIENSHDL